jgi:acetyl esterase/lipase
MGTCSASAKRVLDNYEGTSRNVPLTLRPLIENIDLIQSQIVHAIIDMRLNETEYALRGNNIDGRGAWRMVLRTLLRIVGECNVQILQLPVIPKNESTKQNITRRYTQSHVLPVLASCSESLQVLTTIFPTLLMVTLHPEAVTEAESKALIASYYTHPFWYDYDSNMTRFRNLFDLLKLSILNSYTKSNFFSRNFARGINGLQALITTNRVVSKQADDLGREHANMKFVKSLWNLAETGLPEKVISWMKPGIKLREYFRLNLDDAMRGLNPSFAKLAGIRVLYLYYVSEGAIKIPKAWRTHAPYSSKDADAQQLVASTLVDVEKRGEAETAEKEASKAKVKKKLIAEYEEAESKHHGAKREKKYSSKDLRVGKDEVARKEEKKLKSPRKHLMDQREVQSASASPDHLSAAGPQLVRSSSTPRVSIASEEKEKMKNIENEALASSSTTSPLSSRPSSPLKTLYSPNDSEVEDVGTIEAKLFKEMPLEPFLPREEGEDFEIDPTAIAEHDLADITDVADPAIHGHVLERAESVASTSKGVDGAKAALKAERKKAKSSTIPRSVDVMSGGNYDVVLHFHGGGFVSGSPSSHESYLRTWANTTNAIVFSVDYSLGPEFKYPVGFNECFFFYHWLVSQDNALGIKPRKIVLAGDSAGGNLAVAVALKAVEAGIRIPDGVVAAYPALDCTKSATPSRLVFGNDILVPWYFLEVCLDGYVDSDSKPHSDYALSPLYAPDELISKLPADMVFMVAGYDPLLDDTIRFLRRLDRLNKTYIFEVYDCPHGFWNFDALLIEAERAMYRAGNMIRCMFDPQYARSWQLAEERAKRAKAASSAAAAFSLDSALQPHPEATPSTFAPFSPHEVIYHLAHANKPKSRRATPESTPISAGAPTHAPSTTAP